MCAVVMKAKILESFWKLAVESNDDIGFVLFGAPLVPCMEAGARHLQVLPY